MTSAQRPRSVQLSSTGMRALTGASRATGSAPAAQGLPRTSAIPALERLFFSVSYTTRQGRPCHLSLRDMMRDAPWPLASSCPSFVFLYISFTFSKSTENRQDGMVQGTTGLCPLHPLLPSISPIPVHLLIHHRLHFETLKGKPDTFESVSL